MNNINTNINQIDDITVKKPTNKINGLLIFSSILNIVLIGLLIFISVFAIGQYYKKPIDSNGLLQIIKDNYYENLPSTDAIAEGQLKGMVQSLNDPYSEYLNTVDTKDLTNNLNGKFVGIGVLFDFKTENKTSILTILPDSPAQKADLKNGDILLKIDGIDIINLNSQEIVSKIRGQIDTLVNLTFLRNNEIIEKSIKRAEIKSELITFQKQNEYGIITIKSFGENLAEKIKDIAKQIKADTQVTKIIIDLRSNSGGLLDQVINLSSYFVEPGKTLVIEKMKQGAKGAILQNQEDKNKIVEELLKTVYTDKDLSLQNYPLSILIDKYSASASEIMAISLKENKNNATIFGQKSYGKGVVQRIIELPNKANLKLTVAKWYSPNGNSIDKVGVQPDVLVDEKVDTLQFVLRQK